MATWRACNRRRAIYVLVAVRAVILCVSWPSVCLLPLQVIDDPCGNSFVESTDAPSVDPQLRVEHYTRTQEQDLQLGILSVCLCVCVCACVCVRVCMCAYVHACMHLFLLPCPHHSLPVLFPLPLFLLLYRQLLSVNQAKMSQQLTVMNSLMRCGQLSVCL